jgi:dynein light intermediate chain 2
MASEPSPPEASKPDIAARRLKKKDNKEENFEESIFARLVEEQNKVSLEEEFANDILLLVCGAKKSGKTSLIDRFNNATKDEKDVPKPTVALDYKYARFALESSNSKMLAHIYDLGGDENVEELVKIPLSPAASGNMVCAITVDLSEPHSVVPSLEKWLNILRVQATNSLHALAKDSANGQKRVAEQQAARMAIWEEHPDKASLLPFPVGLVIFATKYDVLVADVDPEKRKGLCKALRYFSHAHGASLVCTSTKDKASLNTMRNVLRQMLFGVTPKGGIGDQLDPSKPVCILAGKDNLQSIGAPHGTNGGEQAWRDLCAHMFPDTNPAAKGGKRSEADQVSEELPKHSESGIDGMVEQRLEELQQYRRQVERNQRLASESLESKVGVY